MSSGPPYVHTYTTPLPVWVDCRDCQGSEGAMVNGEWQDCTACRGEGGHMAYPQPGPALTITEAPPGTPVVPTFSTLVTPSTEDEQMDALHARAEATAHDWRRPAAGLRLPMGDTA